MLTQEREGLGWVMVLQPAHCRKLSSVRRQIRRAACRRLVWARLLCRLRSGQVMEASLQCRAGRPRGDSDGGLREVTVECDGSCVPVCTQTIPDAQPASLAADDEQSTTQFV